MNIGINTLFYLPGEVGGTETYLLEILRVWKEQKPQHQFTLFTQNENHELLSSEFGAPNWHFVPLRFSARRRVERIVREQTELPWRAKSVNVDVLWSPGYTMPLRCHCPQVVTIHDMQYKTFPEDFSLVARLVTDTLIQQGTKRAAAVIAVSEFSRSEILKYTKASPEKVHVTLEAASPDFAKALEGGNVPAEATPYLLSVGNSYPHKGLDQLVRAFGKLLGKIPHNLILVGRPARGEAALQAAIAGLADPRRCIRKSGLSREELASLYQNSAVFVFPSRYEGFGLPVLEALMAGAPVVTTRCGSIPEIGGDSVIYYDWQSDDDLVAKILQHSYTQTEGRVRDRRRLLTRASSFRWTATANATLNVLIGE